MTKVSARELEAGTLNNGQGRRFELNVKRQGVEQIRPAFVVAFDNQLYAYENRCPHQGMQLDWEAGEFFDEAQSYLICATHGALFDPRNGECVSGPCIGQSLQAVSIPPALHAPSLVK